MPTDFKNVNEITQQVMEIVKTNSDLRDVWIQGKVSEVRRTQNGDLNFMLTDESWKIECVIFNDWVTLKENFLANESSVSVVKGQIYVYRARSEYRFMVTDINLPEDPLPAQPVSVSALTNTLQTTLKTYSGEVQGKILEFSPTPSDFTILKLKDVNANGQSNDIIECVLPRAIVLPFSLKKGERVNVKGQFGIFARASSYQISIDDANNITQVSEMPIQKQLRLDKCKECHQHFSKLKDQLCHICYDASLTSEGIVVGAVLRYFNAPRFANFSTKREYLIKWGANKEGRADIVLLNSEGNPVAIAECKRIEYDGNDGIVQLEGYIGPTVAKLGLFADNTDPYEWTFLKRNVEKMRYDKISRSQFERELGVEPASEIPAKTRLELIHGNIIEAEVDAVVNAANAELNKGSGVDGAIRDAGGEAIDRECREIVKQRKDRPLPQGHAVITTGGNLHASSVIHAVGPIWQGGDRSEPALLADCYKNSLQLAVEKGIRSIAFPAISTGNYGFPIEQATPIALNTVKEFVEQAHQNNEMVPEHIQFVLFHEEVYDCYVKEFSTLGLGLSCFIG